MMKKIASSRLRALLLQALVMLFFSALAAFAPLLWPPFKIMLHWILLPVLGALTSGLLAFSGVSCYAAWILPPVIVSALPWLLLGYPIDPGAMLLCALLSMIGASTGEVLRKRRA